MDRAIIPPTAVTVHRNRNGRISALPVGARLLEVGLGVSGAVAVGEAGAVDVLGEEEVQLGSGTAVGVVGVVGAVGVMVGVADAVVGVMSGVVGGAVGVQGGGGVVSACAAEKRPAVDRVKAPVTEAVILAAHLVMAGIPPVPDSRLSGYSSHGHRTRLGSHVLSAVTLRLRPVARGRGLPCVDGAAWWCGRVTAGRCRQGTAAAQCEGRDLDVLP